jgi:hypothetical protein
MIWYGQAEVFVGLGIELKSFFSTARLEGSGNGGWDDDFLGIHVQHDLVRLA